MSTKTRARFTPDIRPGAFVLVCVGLLTILSVGSAHMNSSYPSVLLYQPPGTNASTVTSGPNEIDFGEEIILSFIKRFIGPEKVKSSPQKTSFFENLRRFAKTVEDLLNHEEPKTYSVVTEIPIVSPKAGAPKATSPENRLSVVEEGRGKMKDMMFSPYMLIPQLIMLGFSPIVLANLKMFVMQTLMLNQMAFSAALWMTIRNMVFGPTPETPVKYYNFGYEKPHHSHPRPQQHHEHQRRMAPGRRRTDK